jgi:hypothetical protein
MIAAALKRLRLLAIGAAIISTGTLFATYGGSTVLASHTFEAGVQGSNIPDNTHIRLFYMKGNGE